MMLNKVSIKVAPLSNRIVLARFGKDPSVALETRDVMNEFLQAVVQYGEKAEVSFGGGDEQFTLTVARNPTPATRAETPTPGYSSASTSGERDNG